MNKAREQLEEKEQAITTLQTENQKLKEHLAEAVKVEEEPTPPPGEVEPESPAVNLSSEKTEILEEQTPAAVTGNPVTEPIEGTVNRGGLLEYINKKFPGSKINPKQITNAVYRQDKALSKLESKYSFKYLGKINGENRFKII